MKNILKAFGIVALVAVIVFSMAACGGNPFLGRWSGSYEGASIELIFTSNDAGVMETSMWGFSSTDEFTYTRKGKTATILADGEEIKATITDNILVIEEDGERMVFTKQ